MSILASTFGDFAAQMGHVFLQSQTWSVTGRTLLVSLLATFIAFDLALLIAAGLMRSSSRLARAIEALLSAFIAIPAVVIGLLGLMVFTSAFPGSRITLSLLPMVAAQAALLLPLATTLILAAIKTREADIGEELRSLGASRGQVFDALLRDCWASLAGAAVLVFSRGIAEVGTVLIVGGNLEGHTQVLTTLIAEQARNGAYEPALALALILIVIALALTVLLGYFRRRGHAGEMGL